MLKQWDILERHLGTIGQNFVALPDRPTIADISYLPFTMPWMFTFLGVDIKAWPHIEAWSERMLERPAVQRILLRGPNYGHELEREQA